MRKSFLFIFKVLILGMGFLAVLLSLGDFGAGRRFFSFPVGRAESLIPDGGSFSAIAWSSSQEAESTYSVIGKVVSLSAEEMAVMDKRQNPPAQYLFILNEQTQLGEGIAVGSKVRVTYTSQLMAAHHRKRTAVSVELVNDEK